jgi:hypothetical protein
MAVLKKIVLKGKSRWDHVTSPGKFKKWTIDLCLDAESLTMMLQLKKEGVLNKLKHSDDGYWVALGRPTEIKLRDGTSQGILPPVIRDREGKIFTGRIGDGSDIVCYLDVRSYKNPISGEAGMALRLTGVDIENLAPSQYQLKQVQGVESLASTNPLP